MQYSIKHRDNTALLRRFLSTGLVWLWVTISIIMLDRYTKIWVVSHLVLFEPVQILPIFNLTLAYNTGAAFSLLDHAAGWQNILLGSIAAVISLIILKWLSNIPSSARWLSIALCLVLGGALGNAWDRVLYGYVIDFFDFHLGSWHFAIFNAADAAICIGAVMLLLHWLLGKD